MIAETYERWSTMEGIPAEWRRPPTEPSGPLIPFAFERDASSGRWTEAARLEAPDALEGDVFGAAVAIDEGDGLVAHGTIVQACIQGVCLRCVSRPPLPPPGWPF